MMTPIDLAFQLGQDNGDMARKIVLALLRTNPQAVMDAYINPYGVNAPTIPQNILGTVITLLRCNERVRAVKEIRTATGCGLKEALDAVKALEAELKIGPDF